MSVFGKNDSRCLSNFLQTHIFWNFGHISGTYDQINYRNIWFEEVIIILIMSAQVLFSNVFLKKIRTLMPLSCYASNQYRILPAFDQHFSNTVYSLRVNETKLKSRSTFFVDILLLGGEKELKHDKKPSNGSFHGSWPVS